MTLPEALQQAIEQALSGQTVSSLMQAAQEVSARYRQPDKMLGASFLVTNVHRLAYLATRLPATYSVVRAVVGELTLRAPELQPKSLLDVGAGPGTGMWAIVDAYPSLENITLLEQDDAFMNLGRQLASHSDNAVTKNAHWIQGDMEKDGELPTHDVVLLSYSIGEIQDVAAAQLLRRCYAAANSAVIVIEPGTPRGYQKILAARETLIQCGGKLIAPCPHQRRCPMQGTPAWCHFPCRVSRTSAHRLIKEGTLGYEDEKYSYVIVTKGIGTPVTDRVVGHPSRKSGHVHIELCTPNDGIQKSVISKRQGDLYRWARRADWGDGYGQTIS